MQKYGKISIGKFLKLAHELERRILIATRGKMGHYRFDSTSKSASVGEVLLATSFDSKEEWAEHLRAAGLKLRVAPEETGEEEDLSKVEFAVCWQPPPGLLQRCINLKAIQAMGAGVDNLLSDPTLPQVPILRIIDPLMAERMATWVLWGCINIQRRCDQYYEAQKSHTWDKSIENHRNIDNAELRIGIMGMGVMGGATAKALSILGYKVSAWTRRPRDSADGVNVECFSGKEQLRTFCSQSDILVCLLPLTPETTGILNRDVFSLLPRGSAVINAARGKHLVVDDLIESLDSGHLCAAILDVFEKEPLPANSPLWSHPKGIDLGIEIAS